jgi:hypothetical protein
LLHVGDAASVDGVVADGSDGVAQAVGHHPREERGHHLPHPLGIALPHGGHAGRRTVTWLHALDAAEFSASVPDLQLELVGQVVGDLLAYYLLSRVSRA